MQLRCSPLAMQMALTAWLMHFVPIVSMAGAGLSLHVCASLPATLRGSLSPDTFTKLDMPCGRPAIPAAAARPPACGPAMAAAAARCCCAAIAARAAASAAAWMAACVAASKTDDAGAGCAAVGREYGFLLSISFDRRSGPGMLAAADPRAGQGRVTARILSSYVWNTVSACSTLLIG